MMAERGLRLALTVVRLIHVQLLMELGGTSGVGPRSLTLEKDVPLFADFRVPTGKARLGRRV